MAAGFFFLSFSGSEAVEGAASGFSSSGSEDGEGAASGFSCFFSSDSVAGEGAASDFFSSGSGAVEGADANIRRFFFPSSEDVEGPDADFCRFFFPGSEDPGEAAADDPSDVFSLPAGGFGLSVFAVPAEAFTTSVSVFALPAEAFGPSDFAEAPEALRFFLLFFLFPVEVLFLVFEVFCSGGSFLFSEETPSPSPAGRSESFMIFSLLSGAFCIFSLSSLHLVILLLFTRKRGI
ncbi:MAG: hypothetical protein IJH93_01540 [Lachnospiraceae bacterium]|nr:hypothetical protein [Lachnospiraceae bacterium]